MQPGAVPHVKIVAGNKCDLANSRQVSSQEGLAWARGHDCGCVSDLSICFVLGGGVVFEGGDHCWPPCGCGVLEGSCLTSLDTNWGERRGTANYQYYCYHVLVKYVWLIFWSAIGSWRHQPVTSSMSRKLSLVSTPHFYSGFRFTAIACHIPQFTFTTQFLSYNIMLLLFSLTDSQHSTRPSRRGRPGSCQEWHCRF